MIDKQTILVTGATGAQGGSVARHLLNQGAFNVRCLTRNTDSMNALKLKEAGAEVVMGDLSDKTSLMNALKGCYGVYGVTNFWEHFDKEFEQGKNLIDAVHAAGIKHFIFSGLPNAEKDSNGELPVPHFDIKARLEEYAQGLGMPVTFVHVAFYYENFLDFFPPQKQADGTLGFGFPQGETPLAGVSVEDVGGVVTSIFNKPEDFIGRTVGIVGDDIPPQAYAETMTRILGKTVTYNYIPREVFANFDFPGADDLANMFEYNRKYILNRKKDQEESMQLNPHMNSFENWLLENQDKFKI